MFKKKLTTKRVVIAGCRDYNNYDEAKTFIDFCLCDIRKENDIVIVSGCASGADAIGERYAKENGHTAFTTTLLISPYQKHEELIKIGKEMAEKYNIEFLYRDFRVGFREGQAKARELGLYMQKYCGCVFSEEDRYLRHNKK